MLFMFPGQGSQSVGMGKSLFDNFSLAKLTFEEANHVLQFDLSRIMFDGPEETLMLTENAQPALLVVSIAALRVFLNETKKSLVDVAQYVCGHSLGEYTAVCAAGGISFADAVKIVRERGVAMSDAAKGIKGGMIAVMKSDINTVEKIIKEVNGFCEIANDNSADQIVVSGDDDSLKKFTEIANINGVKRLIRLPVSAPFHSSIMSVVANYMQNRLNHIPLYNTLVPLISNFAAEAASDKSIIQDLLIKQINNRVRWREVMEFAQNSGVKRYIEFGSGRVLSNIIKKSYSSATVYSLHSASEIDDVISMFV